jgi:hypothetical protein
VVVAGRAIVEGKRLVAADPDEILREAAASSGAVWSAFQDSDFRGRRIETAFPPSLEAWDGPA